MDTHALADIQRRLQRLEDKEAITALLNRYCRLADTHQWNDYVSCFLPDAIVQFDDWDDVVGRENIAALISSAEDRFQGQQHSLTNIELSIDGNEATGNCYLWFAATLDTSKPHNYHGFGGPYRFSFKRTDDGWKIATLKLRKIWAQNPDTEGYNADERTIDGAEAASEVSMATPGFSFAGKKTRGMILGIPFEMKCFAQLAALSLALLPSSVVGLTVPRYFQNTPFTRRDLSVTQVQQELGASISNGSTIFGPDDPRFANATERYSTHAIPDIEVVVVPATEADVSTIVKYCDDNSIEFFAINRGHARTYSVGAFKGLMIDMKDLLNIDVQPDQKTAWFQGGVYDGQVMQYLWDRGLVATTGSCDCVGMMGPGLGGGHGRHEGLYGMISDNLVQLNVVLANGTAIVVNETSHPDLLWAMKGAGHNFGIVTSFQLKVWPREVDLWHYHNYIWTEDKLEALFEEANRIHKDGNTPVNLALNFNSFIVNKTISEDKAVIFWSFAYRGTAEEAEEVLAGFNAIEAAYNVSGDVSYPEISEVQGTAIDTVTCEKNHTWIMSTSGLKEYNVTQTRLIYEVNNNYLNKYPQLQTASVVHEGYSNAAVRTFASDSSAFPFRDYNHLTSFGVEIPPGADGNLTAIATQWADEIRALWNSGQPGVLPSNYVNYASGLEPLPSIYGYEDWRLQRLTDLKSEYDPLNKFRYYNPIIRA